MSYYDSMQATEAANARLRDAYLADQLERDSRSDQRVAERERDTLRRARFSTFNPPAQPERRGKSSAELVADDMRRRNAALQREREREHRAAVRAAKKAAAEAEERSYDQRSSAEKLLGITDRKDQP